MKRLLVLALLLLGVRAASGQPTTIAWRPPTGCTTGQSMVYSTVTGRWSCGSGGLTNSAGANVLAKSNGTNLVASLWTDDGTTTLYNTNKFSVVAATGNTAVAGTLDVTGLVTATAGVTTPANLTTTGTGDVISSDDLQVTDDTELGNDPTDLTTISGVVSSLTPDTTIPSYRAARQGASTVWGFGHFYSGTNFSFNYFNGSVWDENVCSITSAGVLNCEGSFTENGTAVLSGSISDNTIPKGSSGNLTNSTITDDGTTFAVSTRLSSTSTIPLTLTQTGTAALYITKSTQTGGIRLAGGTNEILQIGSISGVSTVAIGPSSISGTSELSITTSAVSTPVNLSTDANLTALGTGQLGDAATDYVGIGIAPSSNAHMTFTAAVGDKIHLYPISGSAAYGFGIQGSTLQYFVDTAGAFHKFGYGDSGAFTTSQAFKGDGTVYFGDTAQSSVDNNLDVLTIGNTGTGQTGGVALITTSHTGSYLGTTTNATISYGVELTSNVSCSDCTTGNSKLYTHKQLYLDSTGDTSGDNAVYPITLQTYRGDNYFITDTSGDYQNYFGANIYVNPTWGVITDKVQATWGGGVAVGSVSNFDVGSGWGAPTGNLHLLSDGSSGALYLNDSVSDPIYIGSNTAPTTIYGATQIDDTLDVTGAISDSNSDLTIGDGVQITAAATRTNATLTLGTDGTNGRIAMNGAAGSNIIFNTSTAGGADTTALTISFQQNVTFVGDIDDSNSDVTINDGLIVTGKVSATGTDPTISTCGTTPSVVGNDHAGIVTVGTGSATACTVTFSSTYTAEPACVITQHLNSGDPLYFSAKSATAFTVTTASGASLVSTKFNYVCFKM